MSKRLPAVLVLLVGALLATPGFAQLQWFGYVGGADDDVSLAKTRSFTNFAHIATSADLYNTFVRDRVTAMSQKGLKATIDLGLVFWCDYDGTQTYNTICWDWQQRWATWKTNNAAILTSSKVLAFAVLDEPFARNADMAGYEAAVQKIKADFPWVKVFMIEAACVVEGYCPEYDAYYPGLLNYGGSLPGVDWIGLDAYGIHPGSNATFLNARTHLKSRFPGKKWMYILDGYYDNAVQGQIVSINGMGTIAREWYDVARVDPDAVFLGVFLWGPLGTASGSRDFPCDALAQHISIGRAITGKARPQTSAPIGSFAIDTNGVATGWACDPDETVCEHPRLDFYVDGTYRATAAYTTPADTFANAQCGTGLAYRFKQNLTRDTAGKTVNLYGTDVDSGIAQIASGCAGSPSCSWTPHLQWFGYVGGADTDLALNETKGFTNFAHLSSVADLNSTYIRDRITATSQKGIKVSIDLGFVLWCGSNPATYRTLCWDYTQRWATWKANNASVLTSDKVVAFAILDEPFSRNADMAGYEAAARMVKTDFPWAKIWMVEAACVIRGNCNGTTYTAFNQYTGTLPNVDWVGADAYNIHPATDSTFQYAINRLKARFPDKGRVYVMDGYWASSRSAAASLNNMGSLAQEWYNVAHDDFGAAMLGVFLWGPFSGYTAAKDFPCTALSKHVAIGREITGKTRQQTALPIGRLEYIDGNGIANGWACDPDGTVCENPRVDFYLDGGASPYTTVSTFAPNDYYVNNQCGSGIAYRFHQNLYGGASGHRTTAVARDLDAGSATLPSNCADNPACIWYSSNYQAKGYMDGISPTGNATGWVCDQDAPQISTQARLVLSNGTEIGIYTANQSNEQAVTDECSGGTMHRFSVQLPSWSRGWPIYAYSRDLTIGDVQIPWLCADPWSCSW